MDSNINYILVKTDRQKLLKSTIQITVVKGFAQFKKKGVKKDSYNYTNINVDEILSLNVDNRHTSIQLLKSAITDVMSTDKDVTIKIYGNKIAVCKDTVKKSTPKIDVTEKIYSCPDGYTKEGYKENTKCYKLVKSSDTYYCEDDKATLKGNLCYYIEESKFLGYTCPYGYTLDNTSCYKMTSEKTNPIWGNPEYKYSKNNYVEGYQ